MRKAENVTWELRAEASHLVYGGRGVFTQNVHMKAETSKVEKKDNREIGSLTRR